jgi:hypothetical protein
VNANLSYIVGMYFVINWWIWISGNYYYWWPPLWSSDHCSWLQIQRSGFGSRPYQIFWEVDGLEPGYTQPREYNCSCSGLEYRDYGRRGTAALTTRHPHYQQKLALTSPTIGGSSRIRAVEFVFLLLLVLYIPRCSGELIDETSMELRVVWNAGPEYAPLKRLCYLRYQRLFSQVRVLPQSVLRDSKEISRAFQIVIH